MRGSGPPSAIPGSRSSCHGVRHATVPTPSPRGHAGPPAYLEELTYPCCIPALGEFGEVPPHGGPIPTLDQVHRRIAAPWDGRGDATSRRSRPPPGGRIDRTARRIRSDAGRGPAPPGRQRCPGAGFEQARQAPVPCTVEDSHSGLVRTIGNRVGDETPRGFKSRILRHAMKGPDRRRHGALRRSGSLALPHHGSPVRDRRHRALRRPDCQPCHIT